MGATVQKSFETDHGLTIAYDDLGPRDGETVVLCHGMAASGIQFAADAEYFETLGYRVLVPNIRGHGRSGTPPEISAKTFAIPVMAADMAKLLDHAEADRVHWVGNSLGGILALSMLPGHEQRFKTLITFGTSYRLKLPTFLGPLAPLGYTLFGRALVAWGTAMVTTRHEGARKVIAEMIRQANPQVSKALAETLARYDLIANGTAASLPILLIRGGNDGAFNSALAPTLAAMTPKPNFTRIELPDGGHCANLDATGQWRDIVRAFWQSHESD
jgi:3-oxoadipate enol-lactonase